MYKSRTKEILFFLDIKRKFTRVTEQKAIGFVPCSASCHVKRNELDSMKY